MASWKSTFSKRKSIYFPGGFSIVLLVCRSDPTQLVTFWFPNRLQRFLGIKRYYKVTQFNQSKGNSFNYPPWNLEFAPARLRHPKRKLGNNRLPTIHFQVQTCQYLPSQLWKESRLIACWLKVAWGVFQKCDPKTTLTFLISQPGCIPPAWTWEAFHHLTSHRSCLAEGITVTGTKTSGESGGTKAPLVVDEKRWMIFDGKISRFFGDIDGKTEV